MPFQPINFNSQPQGSPFFENLIGNLVNGFKAGYLPSQMAQQQTSGDIQNSMDQLKLQQEPQQFQSSLFANQFKGALEKAQAAKYNAQSQNPFYGIPAGDAGQIVAIEKAKQTYGENSQQVKSLQQAWTANLNKTNADIAFKNSLAQNGPKRFSTTLGKTAQELDDVNSGFMPGTNGKVPISPQQQQELQGQYKLKMQKETTDSQARQRALNANNIDITFGMINPKHLSQYGGIAGQAQLKSDQALSALGKSPENYKNYQNSLTAANTLAKQVRQFYGDSVTPEVQKGLSSLTNPASWIKNPEVAEGQFNTFKNIMKQELKTYRGALKSTSPYEESSSQNPFPKKISLDELKNL